MKRRLKIVTLTFLTGSLYAMEQSLPDDMEMGEVKSSQLAAAKEIPLLQDLAMQFLAQSYSEKPYNDENKFTLKAITSSRLAPSELIGLLIKGYMNTWPLLSDKHKAEVIQYFINCGEEIISFNNKLVIIQRLCMNPHISKEDKRSLLYYCSSYIELLGKQCEQLTDKENKTPQEEASIKIYEMHKEHTIRLLGFFLRVLEHTSNFSWRPAGQGSAQIHPKNIEHFTVICEPAQVQGIFPTAMSNHILKRSIFDSLVFEEPYTFPEYFELLGDEFYTALHQAALANGGNANQLEFLAKRGKLADLDKKILVDSINKAFTQWGGDSIVRSLLSNGCSPLVKDKDGQTFLYKAIAESNIKIAQVFIEFLLKQYSSCLNLPENLKDLQVFIALIKGDDEAIRKLITKETINTPLVGTQHITPLWIAVLSNNSALVTYLLNEGADIAIRGEDEETLLHQAARQGYAEIVRILLSKNAIDINAQEAAMGYTALFFAVEEDYLECVKILLEHQADFSITDMSGYTLLDAANKNNQEMIEFLKTVIPTENALEHEDE